jgi:hypothetical protein
MFNSYPLEPEVSQHTHTDETGCQQKQLVNVVINIINKAGNFMSIYLSELIIDKDLTVEEQSRSIIAFFG